MWQLEIWYLFNKFFMLASQRTGGLWAWDSSTGEGKVFWERTCTKLGLAKNVVRRKC